MSNAENRLLSLLDQTSIKDLAEPHSKPYNRWQNIKRGRARAGIQEAEALSELYPQYALWLISGRVAPEIGQIEPDGLDAD